MKTILYVEDNEDNIYMLSNRLERSGYKVLIARDGVAGVTMARETLPDLIIMDLILPELDGFDAARQLRSCSTTRNIPIIALSASVLPEDKHRAIDAGCDDFEVKPVDFELLRGKIKNLISSAVS